MRYGISHPKPAPLVISLTTLGLFSFLLLSCSSNSSNAVSYAKQIKPLLDQHCIECHVPGAAGHEKSGLSMESYDALMKGTRFGPVIVPGDALSSTLVLLVEGKSDPAIKMPHGNRNPLVKKDVTTIKNWINQGAVNN